MNIRLIFIFKKYCYLEVLLLRKGYKIDFIISATLIKEEFTKNFLNYSQIYFVIFYLYLISVNDFNKV
jgi:hypothetical protein